MSKRFGKVLLALALMLALVLGDLAAPCLAWTGSGQGLEGRAEGFAVLQAKSKKKKNTATPVPAESETPEPAEIKVTPTPVPEGPITDPQSIADYLFSHDMQLPDNFITKKEARELGWGTDYRYVSDVAPGKSIGGDHYGNYERTLPTGKGISYHEADCYYTKGSRNAARVVYSTDGRVWYTEDHYNTFTELFPSGTDGAGK